MFVHSILYPYLLIHYVVRTILHFFLLFHLQRLSLIINNKSSQQCIVNMNTQLYHFLRVTVQQTEYLIYQLNHQSHIYINNYKDRQIKIAKISQLKVQQKQKSHMIITNLLKGSCQLDSIELHQQMLIMQIRTQGNSESLFFPVQLIEEVGQDYKKVQNMYLIYRQNIHNQQRQDLVSQISELNQKVEKLSKIKYEDTNKSDSSEDKSKSLSQLRYQNIEQKYESYYSKCSQLQKELKTWQEKFRIISEINKQLEDKLERARIRQIQHRQSQQKRNRYISNHYEQINNERYGNHLGETSRYSIERTHYFQAREERKVTKTKDGFNQFVFEPFSIGKYISCFQINDKNISFRQRVSVYHQLTSFHGFPMTGKTKIGFKVIQSKNGNILVGILLGIRKRLRYSFQHPNIISYKLKGGRYALYQDGVPFSEECEQVNVGQCLWMIINREQNTIEFIKNRSIVRPMPKRFKTVELFPFITMKDQHDQLQII